MLKHCVLALLLACLAYSVTPSMAQDSSGSSQEAGPPAGPPEHARGSFDPAQRADMLAKHLQLSSDQQAKVLDILKSAQSQMESLRSDTSMQRADRRSKMMEIRKSSDDQIRSVLDNTQQKKWDAMQDRRQQWHHQHAQPPNPPDASEQK